MWVGGPQNAQDDNKSYTEHVQCSEDVRVFLLRYRQQQIRTIERNYRVRGFGVAIDERRARDKIFVTGIGEGLDIALDMVQALIDKVVCESFEIVQAGIATYCAKGRLDSLLRIVNNEEKCYVRVEKKFLQVTSASSTANGSSPTNNTSGASAVVVNSGVRSTTDSSFVKVTPQGHQISWKIGDIATEQVRLRKYYLLS